MSSATEIRDYERVESAIRFLEENVSRQPTLDEVASQVGLSKYHFQRLFQRWAGVSPKRFLQFLTVRHARDLLRDEEPVLSTAYQIGLSGGSRLHDLFVAVDAVTPGEFKEEGRGLEIRYGLHPSHFGSCLLGITPRGICWLSFHSEVTQSPEEALDELAASWPGARLIESPGSTAPYARRIFRIFEDDPEELTRSPIPLHLKGTNFQIKVWEALLRIPQGRVVTYGHVARSIGRPGASRAVGTAVGQNPVSFLIPCHRVIQSLGKTGGYRWGPTRKKAILGWEAARMLEGATYEHAG